MDKLAWGVLSTAKIAREKVVPPLQRSRLCRVDAIASRDAARGRAVADRLGVARAYGSYEELLADPGIRVVYNPLPNHLHVEWTRKAAEAGKHVLCEKPIGLTAADAQELVKGESEAERVAFARRMRAQLAPLGELELLLADRIVSTAWRLRRAMALEAMLLGEKGTDGSLNPLTQLGDRNRLLAFSRYEAGLERSLYKALHELRRLQARRGGEPVTVLDAEDVEDSGTDARQGA